MPVVLIWVKKIDTRKTCSGRRMLQTLWPKTIWRQWRPALIFQTKIWCLLKGESHTIKSIKFGHYLDSWTKKFPDSLKMKRASQLTNKWHCKKENKPRKDWNNSCLVSHWNMDSKTGLCVLPGATPTKYHFIKESVNILKIPQLTLQRWVSKARTQSCSS